VVIPELKASTGFKMVEINECGEAVVNTSGVHPKIHVKSMYSEWGISGSLPSVYIREGVLNRLIAVAEDLPPSMHLLLLDGLRPVAVQQSLFDSYVESLIIKFPKLALEHLEFKAMDFVSKPSKNPLYPSTHATGGAIDLTLCDRNGVPLNLGTEFDDFSEKANTRYFENQDWQGATTLESDIESGMLRRVLFYAMTQQGFTNFPNEWWHYDFGNQWWGVLKGEKSKYGYIELEG
jgi:D-alanyl-D-alanine dipeptidase